MAGKFDANCQDQNFSQLIVKVSNRWLDFSELDQSFGCKNVLVIIQVFASLLVWKSIPCRKENLGHA